MAWHTLKFREPKIESWSDRYFPTLIIGMIVFVFLLLFSTVIHLWCEKMTNESLYNYRLDVNGLNSIYLNEGEFELKDGRISFEKDGTIYYFTNFRLTDISK